MAAIEVRVPDIGDFKDVPVIEILVKPGDAVRKDDSLLVLESDKATMEVPSPQAGTVKEIRVKVGDKVAEGSPIVVLDAEAAAQPAKAGAQPGTGAPPAAAPAPSEPMPAARASASPQQAAREAAQPAGERGPRTDNTAPAAAAAGASVTASGPATPSAAASVSATTAAADSAGVTPAAAEAAMGRGPSTAGAPAHASPGVRRFARELGVDVARVSGSGPKGRILKEDVQNFVKQALAAPGAGAAAAGGIASLGLPAWPQVDFAKFGPVERQARSRIQKISGPALARNWVMIPHVTQFDEADVTDLEALRKQVNAEQGKDGVKVTLLAFLIKAAVAALKKYPVLNSSLDGDELVMKQYWHIGFAADTPQGLVVPVVRDADRKGVIDIARETAELAAKAREGKLAPTDMQGGTFSISSLGGIGGTAFTPIINAPEVAILGVSKSTTKPVWDGKAFAPRLVLPLSLSYDHRVVDGALAARFTTYLAQALGDLRRVLL